MKKERLEKYSSEGKEIFYDKLTDTLYSDLSETLIDKNLGLKMLEKLGNNYFKKAKEILKEKISKKERIKKIASLLKGIKFSDYLLASEEVAKEANVLNYIKDDIENLYPTKLVIKTYTPQETADICVQIKIAPLYGWGRYIRVIGTLLEVKNGYLTGKVLRIIDDI